MSKEGDEIVATYNVCGNKVDVYGCWDYETDEGGYDFYDLYIDNICINLGCPFSDLPTRNDVKNFILDNPNILLGMKHKHTGA